LETRERVKQREKKTRHDTAAAPMPFFQGGRPWDHGREYLV